MRGHAEAERFSTDIDPVAPEYIRSVSSEGVNDGASLEKKEDGERRFHEEMIVEASMIDALADVLVSDPKGNVSSLVLRGIREGVLRLPSTLKEKILTRELDDAVMAELHGRDDSYRVSRSGFDARPPLAHAIDRMRDVVHRCLNTEEVNEILLGLTLNKDQEHFFRVKEELHHRLLEILTEGSDEGSKEETFSVEALSSDLEKETAECRSLLERGDLLASDLRRRQVLENLSERIGHPSHMINQFRSKILLAGNDPETFSFLRGGDIISNNKKSLAGPLPNLRGLKIQLQDQAGSRRAPEQSGVEGMADVVASVSRLVDALYRFSDLGETAFDPRSNGEPDEIAMSVRDMADKVEAEFLVFLKTLRAVQELENTEGLEASSHIVRGSRYNLPPSRYGEIPGILDTYFREIDSSSYEQLDTSILEQEAAVPPKLHIVPKNGIEAKEVEDENTEIASAKKKKRKSRVKKEDVKIKASPQTKKKKKVA